MPDAFLFCIINNLMLGSHIGESAAQMAANKKMADSFRIPCSEMAKPRLLTEIAILSEPHRYVPRPPSVHSFYQHNHWR